MFVPLVDVLRCVQPHAETWLVASIERAENRHIVEGTLGCPTCLAEYRIRRGVTFFADRPPPATQRQGNEADALRIAAALDLVDPHMTALLHGSWAAHAELVVALSGVQLIALNPERDIAGGDGVSVIVSDSVPLAHACLNGAAVDAAVSADMVQSIRRSLKVGGRLLAPVTLSVPDGFTELARDETIWVARLDDQSMISAPIPLTRRRS